MKRWLKPWRRRRAFTLVELLITIVILAILVGIAYFRFGDAAGQARSTRIASDTRTVKQAVELFYAQTGEYPVGLNDPKTPARVYDLNRAWKNWVSNPGSTEPEDYWVVINIDKLVRPYTPSSNAPLASGNAEPFLGGVPRTSLWAGGPVSNFEVFGTDSNGDGYFVNDAADTSPVVYVMNVATGTVGYYLPGTDAVTYEKDVIEVDPDTFVVGTASGTTTVTVYDPVSGREYQDQYIIYPHMND